ncbi:Gfo/Idh/MocA family oxidoreductase [Microcoleus sp. FACHB-1515]|nr:Gfo/Idh/MocA family oxidoreductase [Microcoleus sp. FACHB-1515]
MPVRVGLVGTGYAAKLRADAFSSDDRAELIAVCGHSIEAAIAFADSYNAQAYASWTDLIASDVDLVVIATVNRDHEAIARAALTAEKHTVVEYPLALNATAAADLIELAQTQQKLLHVEHIELLSGIHQTLVRELPQIGNPFYVRYASINPQHPAPNKWTYQPALFGFPFIGALSRIHRLTAVFGTIDSVACQARFSGSSDRYTSCLCTALLRFSSGLVAEVVYGKGEALWQAERSLVIQGDRGALVLDTDKGTLISAEGERSLDMGTRRGLFAKDTANVLDHLTAGAPLYVSPSSSLYALKVAEAAMRSAETGEAIDLRRV